MTYTIAERRILYGSPDQAHHRGILRNATVQSEKEFMRKHKPCVFMLHRAAWRCGYRVNGRLFKC